METNRLALRATHAQLSDAQPNDTYPFCNDADAVHAGKPQRRDDHRRIGAEQADRRGAGIAPASKPPPSRQRKSRGEAATGRTDWARARDAARHQRARRMFAPRR